MTLFPPKSFRNGQAVSSNGILSVAPRAFRDLIVSACAAGGRVCALYGLPSGVDVTLHALLAHDDVNRLSLLATRTRAGEAFPSMATALPSVQAMERALFEEHDVKPEGHPWLKALRRHPALEPAGTEGPSRNLRLGHPFFRVEGAGIHEVAVGPVHAGVIEPGHFRFQCSGEIVHTLEIHLGYQHRGALACLVAAPPAHRPAIAESLVGDGAVSHGLAYCTVVEALAGVTVPERARTLRLVALELERISDHIGDFGALCNDVGYLPAASWCPRLRGDIQNAMGMLTRHRFGRGFVIPGGIRAVLKDEGLLELAGVLATFEKEFTRVATLALDAPSVLSRFEGTGILPLRVAQELGLLGLVARASGCDRDARRDQPLPRCLPLPFPPSLRTSGDVLARARIRVDEMLRSLELIREWLSSPPDGSTQVPVDHWAVDAVAVALVEGSRGQVTHVGTTDVDGNLSAYRVFDPSLLNWPGLAMAMRGQQISDFPLCNKSFDLSYAGHDL